MVEAMTSIQGKCQQQVACHLKFSISTKPKQPALIVTRRADRLMDCHCSLRLAQVWDAEYWQHEAV
ncbi:hypothetical protein [Nitrosomonas supralitoralis]|uniref:hypothetical protein n=1 Tax=Nitrosomonas supralitoralis TaxID=2116706 RepID=UPI0015589349|nr:hypothetical protein [Nitrosomonas supralitoralis]